MTIPRLTDPEGSGNGTTIAEITRLFLRLGCTVFGGPAAHVAVMETEVVTHRRWMTRDEFLDHLGVVQVLPGPNSTELAIHIGHSRRGWRGGMVAGLAFVLPSVLLVWVLAVVAGERVVQPVVRQVLWWVVPVVTAVLLQALWTFGRQSASRRHAAVILPIVTALAFSVDADLLVLLCGATVAMVLSIRVRPAATVVLAVLAGACTLSAAVLRAHEGVVALAASPETLSILLYFLRAGVSVFGSGYVLFAFLQNDLVGGRGWLTAAALSQAAAFAQVTPGPLFSTATAVGYTVGGHAGALAATVGVFAPAFLSIGVSGPIRRSVQRSSVLRAALDGVVLASVALLGRALAAFAWPLRSWQWVVLVVAAVVLFRTRVRASLLLSGAAITGLAAYVLHFTVS